VNPVEESGFLQRMRRMETLLQEADRFADPAARDTVRELVQLLMDLHGAGLAKMLALAAQGGEAGRALIETFARDELVASLLLLYGLHPVDFETRVRLALEKVRPYLSSQGGSVELLGTTDGIIRLRLEGKGNGCPSTLRTLQLAIEEALHEAAPDLVEIRVEGAEAPGGGTTFIPVEQLLHGLRAARPDLVEPPS
jgi:Fe-S cluster biogenesis protein NfuA